MIDAARAYEAFRERGIDFFSGVPDSLLKDFCAYVTDQSEPSAHVIAANEGSAVGLAAGHYLATGRPALVYLQNSGLGNTVNPLLSLADADVYHVPLLLLVGWRGEPGTKDEPQHVKQGKITLPLLDALGVPCRVLPQETAPAVEAIDWAVGETREREAPVALVVRKSTFAPYRLKREVPNPYTWSREDALKLLVDGLDARDVVVATTGMTSRELFEHRAARGYPFGRDFLTVGSMGHASQIAFGIALAKPDRNVYCLDGDGALIMHLGGLVTIGTRKPRNFKHVVLNNAAHESVGGQPTAAFEIDVLEIARGCGYDFGLRASSPRELAERLPDLQTAEGPALLELRVGRGARPDLARPTTSPVENKKAFMRFLSS